MDPEEQKQQEQAISDSLEERTIFTWRAPERLYKPRSREFFGTMMVLAVLVAVILFFIEGVMPVLVVAAVCFVVYATSRVEPRDAEYVLSTKGIEVAGQKFGWEEMVLFWDEKEWGRDVVHVLTTRRWPLQLMVILPKDHESVDIKKVKVEMAKWVKFERPPQTQLDRFGKWFKERVPLE